MPSKSKSQARFMRACDHGWTPPKDADVQCPPKEVSHEFVVADKGLQSDRRTVDSRGYRKKK